MLQDQPVLQAHGLTKSFGGALALDQVNLTILPRQVHGLLGENGSGKSTLIKILAGYHVPDEGTLRINGQNVPLPLVPGGSRALGLEFVHQDLGLIPSLSVAENLLMSEIAQPSSSGFFFSWSRAEREVQRIFAKYNLALDPQAEVESIRPVERALLAIVRALEGMEASRGENPGLLVLDEPTVFLPQQEVSVLFDFVQQIAQSGSSVLFVSHDLDEVLQITDRITVLRDGRDAGEIATADTSPAGLVHLIVGHDLTPMMPVQQHVTEDRPTIVGVRGLTSKGLHDLSFDLHAGEILGFTGLVGSGYEDVVYALFGANPARSGTFQFKGGRVIEASSMTPVSAMASGLALVPGDRQRTGSIPSLSVSENVNLLVLDRYFKRLRLRERELDKNAESLMLAYDVRPMQPDMDYESLSGGNQQKAMMAKWQEIVPEVLLLDEPTQGVDVGARQQIWKMIRETAAAGATICASSDHEQLAAICDRVGVITRGRLVGFLTGPDISKDRIADLCLRSSAEVSTPVSQTELDLNETIAKRRRVH